MGSGKTKGIGNMNKNNCLSLCAIATCFIFGAYTDGRAAPAAPPATNLLTICLSATATTQASKCTKWEYNVYSPSAYIESYPQVSPGPKTWTDPAYEYRLGSTITGVMGVKVCPTALVPGTTFNSPQADPCPNNVLVSASGIIFTAQANTPTFNPAPGTYGPREITSAGLSGQTSVTLSDTSPASTIYYTANGPLPGLFTPAYTGPILLPPGTTTTIQATAFAPNANAPSPFASGVYTVPLFPSDDFPEPVKDLLTVCTSATGTTQAAKCTGWQYNFFSPAAYLESYPQVSPGSKGFTDPAYEYRLGSTLIPTNGVKVCPGPLLPGVSFSSTNADVCPSNALVAASTVIPTPATGSSVFLIQNEGQQNSCAYYQAIGAIPAGSSTPCALNPDGSFAHGITKTQWLNSYYYTLTEGQEGTALFVNINDLNFVRQHMARMNGAMNASAAIVCNFPGPDFYHSAVTHTGVVDQPAVDAAIQNAQNGVNPLPCVAFDYGLSQPYIRFLVFNAAGNLAAAVDLDGRGPKQIPNACSACHGVPNGSPGGAEGQQPQNASSYIPFDESNFVFSSKPGLARANQEAQIAILNLIVLKTGLGNSMEASEVSKLIHGWYDTYEADGFTVQTPLGTQTQQYWAPPDLVKPTLFPSDNPMGTATTATYPAAIQELAVYLDIYAPYCRSCHVANQVELGVTAQVGGLPTEPGDLAKFLTEVATCNPTASLTMPNSKIAFDRFWTTHTQSTSADNDLALLLQSYLTSQGKQCNLRQFSPALN
jgi:mono/diheme cytochrome c family protein